MFVSDNLSVNEKGHLTIGGVDTITLADTFKTPLYVMDEDLIRQNCKGYKEAIDRFYGGNGLAYYASKAFCCKEIYRIVMSEGLGIDVVSAGELATALSVDFPTHNICFHGNNKSDDELAMAVDNGVGRIIVDNIFELERLNNIAEQRGKVAKIMFRIKPGVEAHTHEYVQTGKIDSKFGFALETGEAFEAVKKSLTLKSVELSGLHCHIGSQIFGVEPFELAAEVMLKLISKIKNELSYSISELNLGGGFGIRYVPEHNPVGYDEYMKSVSIRVEAVCKKLGLDRPRILLEPGRTIVGSAGITLYTVGGIKEIPNIRTYVSVDGSMCDNPRYSLYKSEYTAVVANKANLESKNKITLSGRCCEKDLLGEDMLTQDVEIGDIVAVLATGAYNYSMSSNYNRLLKPPVIMLKNGEARVIVKGETIDDLMRNDI